MFYFGKFFLRLKRFIIVLTVFFLLIILCFIYLFERFAVPAALELAKERSVSRVNSSIAEYLKERIRDEGLEAGDLYNAYFDEEGRLTYLEVNSVMVNTLCADTAEHISKELNKLSTEKISLPVGVLTGLGFFSHLGDGIPVYITPSGKAEADYETEVVSAGIGQVNFKVWLVVDAEMGVVNPLFKEKFGITRKLMLVNTVFNGEVPSNFYGVRN